MLKLGRVGDYAGACLSLAFELGANGGVETPWHVTVWSSCGPQGIMVTMVALES